MAAALVMALAAAACGAGGSPGGQAAGAAGAGGGAAGAGSGGTGGPPGGLPAQAGSNGSGSQDPGTGGGPPPGAGNGHAPAGIGQGAPANSGTPDRNPNVIRPGKWKITDLSGEIVAHITGGCRPTTVAYDPDSAGGFGTLELTGDGRVQFHWTWLLAGSQPSASTTTNATDPPIALKADDPPLGDSTWNQTTLTGRTPDSALKIQATFDTPSILVGNWQYSATSAGACTGQFSGQGGWSAQPT